MTFEEARFKMRERSGLLKRIRTEAAIQKEFVALKAQAILSWESRPGEYSRSLTCMNFIT